MLGTFLKDRVTLQRMERNATGGMSASNTYANVRASVQPVRETTREIGIGVVPDEAVERQQHLATGVVYLEGSAPVDLAHADWKIVHDGRELDVLSIIQQKNLASGLTDHFKAMVR